MNWEYFYNESSEWSESTLKNRISSLKEIGPGHEVVDILIELPTQALKTQLVKKAIKHQVIFTHEDFMNLDGELEDETYHLLGDYAGFDADNPFVDENNLTWDDFYNYCLDWDEQLTLRRINLLKNIDNATELYEIIACLSTDKCKNELFKKGLNMLNDMSISWQTFYDCYYDLTKTILIITISSLKEMGPIEEIYEVYEDLDNDKVKGVFLTRAKQLRVQFNKVENDENQFCEEKYIQPNNKKAVLFGVLGVLLATIPSILGTFISALLYPNIHEKSKYCDGDCANCPPHYGYRYGRWYYGHHHQHGCQRHGKGGY